MARPTLTVHRAAVRRLAGDQDAPQTWSDDDLDVALDQTRTFNQYRELAALIDRATNRYAIFEGGAYWEDPVTLYDWQNQVVPAPADVDLIAGRWTFDPGRADSYLAANGWTYDIHGAAVVVLDWWIAKVKKEYDVSVGGDSFKRSQKVENLVALRDEVVSKSPSAGALRSVPAYRSDLTGRTR